MASVKCTLDTACDRDRWEKELASEWEQHTKYTTHHIPICHWSFACLINHCVLRFDKTCDTNNHGLRQSIALGGLLLLFFLYYYTFCIMYIIVTYVSHVRYCTLGLRTHVWVYNYTYTYGYMYIEHTYFFKANKKLEVTVAVGLI